MPVRRFDVGSWRDAPGSRPRPDPPQFAQQRVGVEGICSRAAAEGAARIAGVDHVYRMGGAQAIAAMAYGTASIPRVDIVAGPGNIYVTLAKREVCGSVGLDGLAGPTEVMVIADGSARPDFVAADL